MLLCPLITHLTLKQMADRCPVYVNTHLFSRRVQKFGLASLELQILRKKGGSFILAKTVMLKKASLPPIPHFIHLYN